jgi:hypothetical protein
MLLYNQVMKHTLLILFLSAILFLNGCKVICAPINVPVKAITGRPLFGESYAVGGVGHDVKRWREAGVTGEAIHNVRSVAAPMRADDLGAIHKRRPVTGRWK